MVLIGIGAGLALLLALLTFRAKVRHHRVVRLIHQTPVTTIADVVQSSTADQAAPFCPTHAVQGPTHAVQGRVVARETTRLTAPITGSSCVAYKVRVYDPGDGETPDENYIEDSKWVPWAVDDGTGLALASFDPFRPPKALREFYWFYWPGRTTTGDRFEDNTPEDNTPRSILTFILLSPQDREFPQDPEEPRDRVEHRSKPFDRLTSLYGERLAALLWARGPLLWWEESVLKEFGNEVFVLGRFTVRQGCVHFRDDSDSLFWFGSRSDALSHFQQRAQSSSLWVLIWGTVSVILAVVYLLFG